MSKLLSVNHIYSLVKHGNNNKNVILGAICNQFSYLAKRIDPKYRVNIRKGFDKIDSTKLYTKSHIGKAEKEYQELWNKYMDRVTPNDLKQYIKKFNATKHDPDNPEKLSLHVKGNNGVLNLHFKYPINIAGKMRSRNFKFRVDFDNNVIEDCYEFETIIKRIHHRYYRTVIDNWSYAKYVEKSYQLYLAQNSSDYMGGAPGYVNTELQNSTQTEDHIAPLGQHLVVPMRKTNLSGHNQSWFDAFSSIWPNEYEALQNHLYGLAEEQGSPLPML